MKVRSGAFYRYEAAGMDRWDPKTELEDGDLVTVVRLPGCPGPNVMGHCHVAKDGRFAGLVLTASLKRRNDQ